MAEAPATMIPVVERMPRPPMVEEHRSMSWITDRLAGIPQRKTPLCFWVLGMHILDIYIIVLPFIHPRVFRLVSLMYCVSSRLAALSPSCFCEGLAALRSFQRVIHACLSQSI
jgi:hypothetical protein